MSEKIKQDIKFNYDITITLEDVKPTTVKDTSLTIKYIKDNIKSKNSLINLLTTQYNLFVWLLYDNPDLSSCMFSVPKNTIQIREYKKPIETRTLQDIKLKLVEIVVVDNKLRLLFDAI